MKYLLLLLTFAAAAVSGQTLDRLSQSGCDFVATVAACQTEEVRGKVEKGFCQKSAKSVLDKSRESLPDADFSLIEKLVEQEIKRIKNTKQKDPQKAYDTFIEKCYPAGGEISKLLNQTI